MTINEKNIKYGKSSKNFINHKSAFFNNNSQLLLNAIEINRIYAKQPRRLNCKNCNYPIQKVSFSKLGVDYSICENCTHLNGMHEDTDEFCSYVYTDDKGTNYSNLYNSKSIKEYFKRVEDIYKPKANFLLD